MKTLELSTYNSREVLSNSEYTCTFPPIEISNGSQIQISQAFFDSAINGNYQNISIKEDTIISIYFGLYYANLNDGDMTYMKGGVNQGVGDPLKLYVCRNNNSKLLYTDVAQTLLSAGNYSPMDLADILTQQFTKIPNLNSMRDIALIPGSLLKESNIQYSFPCDINVKAPNERDIGNPISTLTAGDIPVSNLIYPHFPINSNIQIQWTIKGYGQINKVNTVLRTFNKETGVLTFDVRPGINGFVYPDWASGLYFSSINILTTTALVAEFYNQNDVTDYFYFNRDMYIGTSQFAIEFNQDSGKFQIAQMHMPIYTMVNNQAVQGVEVLETGDTGVFGYADTRSGIFFNDLQPSWFWEQLGFDLNKLLVVDEPDFTLSTPLTRGLNITSHFMGYDGFISHTYTLPAVTATPFFYATETVLTLEADNQLSNFDSGYYLIELVGLKTDYLTDNGQQYSAIMNIASKNYNASGFITAYGDGSITYTNQGEPYVLSSIKVRILDPITKQPITTLGPKNSVFIQISP